MSADNINKNQEEQTQHLLEILREEMGLKSVDEVIDALARQAYHRTAILCPRCGHHAQQTEEDKARCESCLSPLKLAEAFLVILDKNIK